jgi:hypothetical protein
MRKAFNFYRSYYEVAMELKDAEFIAFIKALLKKQFEGIEPTDLKGMSKFAYLSQKFSIDSQVLGYETKTKEKLTPSVGGSVGGSEQEKEKEKEKVQLSIDLDLYPTFNDFWNLYDYKKDLETTKKKWNKLSQKEKELIMAYIPQYKLSTPNKEFRKYPSTFLNQKTYKDEITTTQQSELGAIGFDNLTNFLQHERDMQNSNNLKLH